MKTIKFSKRQILALTFSNQVKLYNVFVKLTLLQQIGFPQSFKGIILPVVLGK